MNYNFTHEIVKKISQNFLLPQNHRLLISNSISKTLHLKPLVTKEQASSDPNSNNPRRSAVLIPICTQNGIPSILFTVRTNKVSTHKGQVSFPGGHYDSEDQNLYNTAIRETYEELGNNIGPIEIIGECQTIPAITGTLVTPIIGYIKNDIKNYENFNISINEVDKIFTCSIDILLNPNYKNYEILNRNNINVKMPVFGLNQNNHPKIWGLTGAILDGFIERGLKPAIKMINDEEMNNRNQPNKNENNNLQNSLNN